MPEERYRILHAGFDNIGVKYDSTPVEFSSDLEDKIAAKWAEMLAEAKKSGKNLFDGSMVRAASMKQEGQRLDFNLQRTSFRKFVVTNRMPVQETDFNPYAENPDTSKMAFPLSVGALISTHRERRNGYRNHVIVGQRSLKAYGASTLSITPAGYATVSDCGHISLPDEKDELSDPDTIIGGTVFGRAYNEMNQELNCALLRPLGVILDCVDTRQPMLALKGSIPYSKDETKARWEELKKKEFVELIFVPNEIASIVDFLNKHGEQMFPHSQAALQLYMRDFDRFN